MAKILASDMNGWHSRLQAIRTKYGLSRYSLTDVTTSTIIQASQFKEMKDKMEQATRDATYITNRTFDIGTVGVGLLIKADTKSKIESALTTLEGLCNNCANYSNYSDNSNYSDYSDNSNYGDYSSNYSSNYSDFSNKSNCSSEGAGSCCGAGG